MENYDYAMLDAPETYGYAISTIDDSGKMFIPKEIRDVTGWKKGDDIFIVAKKDIVKLRNFSNK